MTTMQIFAGQEITVPKALKIIKNDIKRQKHQNVFRIMTEKRGDERFVWSTRHIAQINAAKEMFEELLKRGMRAFKVNDDGTRSTQEVKEFNATLGEVIFCPIPAVVGG